MSCFAPVVTSPKIRLRGQVAVLQRELDGDAQGLPARYHGDFVHRVALCNRFHHQRVADLVVGDDRLLLGRDHPAALLGAGHHAKAGLVQLLPANRYFLVPGGEDGRLVQEVCQVGTGEPRRLPRDHVEVDVLGQRLLRGIEAQDRTPAIEVGGVDRHPPIEAAGAKERRIEDVRAVRGRDHDDSTVGIEPVHLHEQLVEGLLTLLIGADLRTATPAPERVDLVKEHQAGGVLLRVPKEVTDAGGAHADEHLDEVRTAQ